MTDARTIAVNCTAKLYTFRKTRDGVFAQFVIHPNEVPEKLQRDPIGTSYMMALVEVDDSTGQPKGGEAHTGFVERNPREHGQHKTTPRPLEPGGGVKKGWDELSPSQQAGILCNDPAFFSFAYNNTDLSRVTKRLVECAPSMAESAAIIVREHCGVTSRSLLDTIPTARARWRNLVADYRAWQHEPEVVG